MRYFTETEVIVKIVQLETEAWEEVDVPKGRVRQNLGLWIL
jgi:hypothetical protein